jgi:hypothetical protein
MAPGVGHGGDPLAAQLREPRHRRAGRDDDHALHVALREEVEVERLALRPAGAVGVQQRPPVLHRAVLDAGGEVGEERVPVVEREQPERAGGARADLAGGLVADEAQALGRVEHRAATVLADAVGVVEHVRDGRRRDPGGRGDVLDAHPAGVVRCGHGAD